MKRRFILAQVVILLITLLVQAKSDITLSILYFDNLTQVKKYSHLTKALTEMLISDLHQVKGIVIIEREQIEKAMKEMALGQTGMIDESTAPKVGEMVGARYLIIGSYITEKKKLLINYKILEVEKGKVLASGSVTGKAGDVLVVKDDLAYSVALSLKKHFKQITVPEFRREDEVISMDKMTEFGRALDYKDKKDFQNAEKVLKSIIGDIPDYKRFKVELSAIEKRLAEYDKTREQLLDEKSREPVTYNSFIQMSGAYVSSMKYTKLLEYCMDLRKSPPKAPEGSFLKTIEQIDYYVVLAFYSLKQWDKMVEEGEHFVKTYPASMYYSAVKMYLAQAINEVKSSGKKANRAEEKVKEFKKKLGSASADEKHMIYYQIATVYFAENLSGKALSYYKKIDLKSIEKQHIPGDMVFYNIFMCYYNLRQRADAEKVINTCEQLYPSSDMTGSMRQMMSMFPE